VLSALGVATSANSPFAVLAGPMVLLASIETDGGVAVDVLL
jgi:hypothetical protein